MGVKDLWTILSPICERKPLWEFQDNCIAIDLSCWICDSQNATDNRSQCNMYLRNLFFRVAYLLLHGILPIFVLEGDAPELKHVTMERRKLARLKSSQSINAAPNPTSKQGNRSGLKAIQTQCAGLLTSMGVPFVRSEGEAEALCAQLNQAKVVNGVITEDSDCFLYGARTVYRNFNLSNTAGASVDTYQMDVIEDKLKLGRNKMIALSLILGCDYDDKGVQGIGKEMALQFLENVDDSEILPRLQSWRTNEFLDSAGKNKELLSTSPSLKLEVKIRQKALEKPCFPSSEIITEFLKENSSLKSLKFAWKQPSLGKFMEIAMRKLKWEESYVIEKFLPVLTRWHLLHGSKAKPIVELEKIIKRRKLRGIASYEVQWKSFTVTTVEPEVYVCKMYDDVAKEYEELNSKGSKKKKKQTQINGKILGDISNQTEPSKTSCQKKPKGKGSKKNAPDKGTQTLDKFLVKLNNLSLHDDIKEPENSENSPDNECQEFDFYNNFDDVYYYEPNDNECFYPPEEVNLSSTNEQMIPSERDTNQTNSSLWKNQPPDGNINPFEKRCPSPSKSVDKNSATQEMSKVNNLNSSQFMADVSMHSCDFEQHKNCSLMEQGSITCSNHSEIVGLSRLNDYPVSMFSSEPNADENYTAKDLQSDLCYPDSFAPNSSTPVSKFSNLHRNHLSEFESVLPAKKTWISKFSETHMTNESISVSDFECDADDIPNLSDIIDCIVNKKS